MRCAVFPLSTAFGRTGNSKPRPAINIGVAIAIRGGGLAAPAIHDADQLSCDQLMAAMRDLVQRMRSAESQLGNRQCDDHRLEPRRKRRRSSVWHHLPAAGGSRRLRQARHARLGRRRDHSTAVHSHRNSVRRSPGQRRPCRRIVPGRDRPAFAGARNIMSALDIHSRLQEELCNIAPDTDVQSRPESGSARSA